MNRYAVTVRRWWTVLGALALLVLVCTTAGENKVPVPSLVRGAGGAQLAYFTPVLVVIAVMYCLERELHEAESTAVVRVRRFDQGAVVLTMGVALAAGVIVGMDIARNVTLLLGIALLVRRLANEATASGAGLMFLILNIMLGRALTPNGHAAHTWWAIALYPPGSVPAWLVALAFFAFALPLSFSRTSAAR